MKKKKRLEKPCRKKAKFKDREARRCRGHARTRVRWSRPHRVTSAQIERIPRAATMMSIDGSTSLLEAFKDGVSGRGGTVYSRSFRQDGATDKVFGSLFNEAQEGKGYFNGSDVWKGRNGYQQCGLHQREVGYDVTVDNCFRREQHESGYNYIQHWDYFDVSFVHSSNPFTWNYNMHVNLHKSGTLTFWFGDDKYGHSDGPYRRVGQR